jgi:ParB-like chromosome segregation protein Spo0J
VSVEQHFDCRRPATDPVTVEAMGVTRLRPYPGNARVHSKKQIRQIANSIQRFGFTNPVLISDDDEIIAGHGRVEAAKLLGMKSVPILRLSHLDAAQRRAYVIADNKLALNAGWDRELLAMELQALIDVEFDVDVTGFSLAEIDFVLDEAQESSPDPDQAADNAIPPLADAVSAVTRCGDLWLLGWSVAIRGNLKRSTERTRQAVRQTNDRRRGR